MHSQPGDAAEFGARYLETLSEAVRRDRGIVYTPPHLVRFILDLAGYVADAPIETVPLLDPACGTGVFLEEALRRLAARAATLNGDLRFSQAAEAFLDAARRNLVGIDVDADACRLAREVLAHTASELTGRPIPVDFFAGNIVEGDFLGADMVRPGGRLAILPPFAVVVGNPPYIATTRLGGPEKDSLRREFRTASGRIDLYVLFFERGVGLLRAAGRLAFITPDKFLSSRSAKPLRTLLRASGAVRTLARFESHKVFRDAATVPCVTLFERGARQGPVELIRCAGDESEAGSIRVLGQTRLSATFVAGHDWAAVHPDFQQVAGRIRGMHPTLDSVSLRVSAGIATGRDGVFVVSADADLGIEPELLRPAVRGRDITAFRISDPSLRILVPYSFEGFPRLIDIRQYPGARRYLAAHRSELESRHCVRVWGKAWYDLHDPIPFDLAKQPMVLVPDVADRNRFAFDPGRHVPLHSAYYIVPAGVEPRFLATILNSRPIEFLIRTTAPRVKDGFSRYRSQFLLGLPIPAPTDRLVRQVNRAHDRGDFEEATDLAGKLFGLSRRDLLTIEDALEKLRTPA